MQRAIRLFAAVLTLVATSATARELHWRELAVDARLESDGTLRVSETQAMVFTGAWNGGERVFRLGLGHAIEIDAISRRDPSTAAWRKLARGSLDELDHWNWTDSKTVRWRSRRPSDAVFADTEIDYRLDYRLTGILRRDGDSWRLDHDFAFADRVGDIESFRLDLELAPEWRPPADWRSHYEAGPLRPGESFVVRASLGYAGATPPERAAPRRLASALRAGGLGALLAGVAALFAWAIRREVAVGKLRSLAPLGTIDRAWIEAHLLSLSPEEVGAAWDEKVGAAEVAALLARLQLEKKISSRVETKRFLVFESKNLHLRLEVPRDAFTPTERKLVDALFFSRRTEVDTEALRKHYRTSGFDPAATIRDRLMLQLGRRREFTGERPRPKRWPSVVLVLGGMAGLLATAIFATPRGPAALVLGAVLIGAWIPAGSGARLLRDRVAGFGGPAIAIVVGQAVAFGALAIYALLPIAVTAAFVAGLVLHLGLTRTMATSMQTRESAERIARRRELARARAWFTAELGRERPDLDDAWVPYVLAFGLAGEMDRWFRAFGGASAVATGMSQGGAWSGASGSGGGSGWTGGGGAFGGAGATATWASAATAMSAGVAAASSSSGGGGGGGGGGSSGGGGGGGW